MDVRAILLAGPASHGSAAESVGAIPIALLDVLGYSVLQRVARRLGNSGFAEVTAVVDASPEAARLLPQPGRRLACITVSGAALWEAAQRVFSNYAQSGADLVLVVRLGAYAEVDYEELIQAHLDRNARITAVTQENEEALGIFVISASRRNDATFLLRHRFKESRTAFSPYRFTGYCNPLSRAADLRRLAVDAFFGSCRLAPAGSEIKPGVWVGKGARVQSGARLLAPAFIGQDARVCSAAVVTRCSALERHTVVKGGTVLEDATVLPDTCVGPGLDVAHAVVGFDRIFDLRRGIEVTVADPRLIGSVRSARAHAYARAAALLAPNFFSFDRLRSLLLRDRSRCAPAATAVETSVAALAGTQSLPGQSVQD